MSLHLTKVAVGATSADTLAAWLDRSAPRAILTTRYLPKRHAEMAGGSLYWILKHRLIGRSPLIGFEPASEGRTHIVLEPRFIPVIPRAKRVHQGWRYLEAADAPADRFDEDAAQGLPPALAEELAALGLL